MKNFRSLIFLWMIFVYSSIALAQEKTIDTINTTHPFDKLEQGWWNISLNGGFSFLTADVDPQLFKGAGVGVSLGRNIFYDKDNWLVTDLRLRFQYGITQGLSTEAFEGIRNNTALNGSRTGVEALNYVNNPGFIYQNYRSSILETAIEIPLYLNPSYMDNRLHFGVFAGLGLGWYHADIDQLDASGSPYDYDSDESFDLDGLSDEDAREALNNAWDGDFETNADGFDDEFLKFSIMPSIGVELGILAKNDIIFGVAHRLSFSRTDLLDGSQWNADNSESEDMDLLHHSQVFIKWNIPAREKENYPPSISKITPKSNELNTREDLAIIRTKLDHVKSVKDITILHNGLEFNVLQFYRKELATNVPLVEGMNEILITVSNNNGTDQERYFINYIPSGRIASNREKAAISFVNPAIENQTVSGTKFNFEAEILGVNSEKEVRLFLNKEEIKSFNFAPTSGVLSQTLELQPGENQIKILALNKNGISQAMRKITADTSGAAVTIDLIAPSSANFTTDKTIQELQFFVAGTTRDKVRLSVNGDLTEIPPNNESPVIQKNIALEQGTNIIRIIAEGPSQTHEKKILITRRADTKDEATLANSNIPKSGEFIIEEYITPVWVEQGAYCSYNLELNYPLVTNTKDVEITLNNQKVNGLRYFEEDRIIRAALRLQPDDNLIKVRDLGNNAPVYDKIVNCEADLNATAQNLIPQTENQQADPDKTNQQKSPDKPTINDAPIIEILSPADRESTISSPTINFEAQIQNVVTKDNLTLYFNDEIISNFEFDPTTKKLKAKLNPRADDNQITLIAINDFGVQDEVRYIQYKQIPPPEINITAPRNQSSFNISELILKAMIKHTGKNDLQLDVNGVINNDWTLEEEQLTASLQLKEGVNRVQLTAVNQTAQRSQTIYINYEPLKAPEITIINPEKNTKVISSQLPLVANVKQVDNKDQIKLYLNDRILSDFSFANGTVSQDLTLREGSNNIKIEASNAQGQVSEVRLIDYRVPRPPQIQAIRPSTNRVKTKTSPYPLEMKLIHVYDPTQIRLKLNGAELRDFNFNSERSRIDAPLSLKEGINEIVIEVQNEDGGDARSILIEYTAPKPPVITMIQPKKELVTESEQMELSANISNIKNKEDISLLVNGRSKSFQLTNAILTSQILLREGSNEIVLTAKNEDGTDEKNVQVQYNKPLPPPVIELVRPRESGSIVTTSSFNFSAELLHIEGSYSINLSLNGEEVPFKFDPLTGEMTAQMNLLEGANEVNLQVENSTGLAKSQLTINYNRPEDPSAKKPAIEFLQISEISSSTFDTSKGSASIVLLVQKVNDRNQLSLSVNEKNISNFVFDAQSGKVISPLTLKKGKNIIELTATNSYGTEVFLKEINF